jgi:hypothetical protein
MRILKIVILSFFAFFYTVACPWPAVAETLVGAPETVAGASGVTLLEAVEALEVPTEFVAVTVKV